MKTVTFGWDNQHKQRTFSDSSTGKMQPCRTPTDPSLKLH